MSIAARLLSLIKIRRLACSPATPVDPDPQHGSTMSCPTRLPRSMR